jgi:tRNA uridine 5-carboxymethylaminomethyl modification enzyme
MTAYSSYDVVIVGSGHAGCEAALAAARIGCRTLVIAPNLDRVGYMPCNPSIGGPGKSQIVAEVDALGGAMAMAADATAMQVRQLNMSKGPAVRAIRIQCDKSLYAMYMKEALETQAGLDLLQDEAIGLIVGSANQAEVLGIRARIAGDIEAASVVITAGTFLRAKMIAGESQTAGGRAGDHGDVRLSESLSGLEFRLRRFKTGTPPRIDARTVDIDRTVPQPGDDIPLWLSRAGSLGEIQPMHLTPPATGPFSVVDKIGGRSQVRCYQTSTTTDGHDLIRRNLHRAPMYNGSIEGTGPRYCPSIEDKVGRFADKTSHPVFLEPEGWRSHEMYVQGMSTSLPPDIQDAVIRTIPGMAQARITRYGYAVEYDALDPTELSRTLESSRVRGLFFAGQVNGTSGYEEAAGQGLVAGANAAARAKSLPELVLTRDNSYIGVMIDDLISKPFNEPYRMLTSRAEYRLLLRSDTADIRLAPLALPLGLISSERSRSVDDESTLITQTILALEASWLGANPRHAAALESEGLRSANRSMTALDVARRPEATLVQVIRAVNALDMWSGPEIGSLSLERAEIAVRYSAFIEKEHKEATRHRANETRTIPADFDYEMVKGLRVEALHQLAAARPPSVGHAARTAGVTPSDIGALLVHLAKSQPASPTGPGHGTELPVH